MTPSRGRSSTDVTMPLPPLTVRKISRTDLALFAGASGDHNPLHIDVDAAREAGFDDVFAHGMLPMAYLSRLLTSCFPQGTIRSLSARFVAPTPVNVPLTCNASVASVASGDSGATLISLELDASLEDGTTIVSGSAVIALEQSHFQRPNR